MVFMEVTMLLILYLLQFNLKMTMTTISFIWLLYITKVTFSFQDYVFTNVYLDFIIKPSIKLLYLID
jgi:hypothetical protein